MLVRHCMTDSVVTIEPGENLATAREKMAAGGFRHMPVVQDNELVGMLTDRDIRRHVGVEARTKVEPVMTQRPHTIAPSVSAEEAAHRMLAKQIGGLPVLEDGRLVGIVTSSDLLRAFTEVIGVTQTDSIRIDVVKPRDGADLADAVRVVEGLGGTVLGVGTYRKPASAPLVFYLRLQGLDAGTATRALTDHGWQVQLAE